MLRNSLSARHVAIWLVGLLLVGLTLAACGGSGETAPEAVTSPPAQEVRAAESADVEEAAEAEQALAEEPAEDQEATAIPEEESSEETEAQPAVVDSPPAECEAVDIPDNSSIAAVSDSEWAKGPADAPLTLIEYGDFQ
jgi:hypothetical protein